MQDLAQLDATAIDAVLALRPEVVILGTGARAVFPPPAVQAQFRAARHRTGDDGQRRRRRTFNVLVSESRRRGSLHPARLAGATQTPPTPSDSPCGATAPALRPGSASRARA